MASKWIIAVAFLSSFLIAQELRCEIQESRVLIDRESIKIVTTDRFPADLTCKVFIGPQRDLPWFETQGTHGQIDAVSINVINGGASVLSKGVRLPVVSVLRKTGTENFVLYLFAEDREGRIAAFFDLNLDGVWDVRKNPTRETKNFILIGNQWIEVETIDGLLSTLPTASIGKEIFEFDESWKRRAEKETGSE